MKQKATNKTEEQLLQAKWEDLNSMEQILQAAMERFDMSLEEAIESLEMLP